MSFSEDDMSGYDFRTAFFRFRSYTPVPLVILMLIFARPSVSSFLWGVPVAISGELLRLWGVSIAGSETRVTGGVGASQLITSGPFAYVRNPLYVGNMLLYIGFGIMSNALFPWLPAAALLFFLVQYSAIVSAEEEFLAGEFGDRYERYRAAVPRFVPSFRKYDSGDRQPSLSWGRGFSSEKRTLQAIVLLTTALVIRGLV
jgi:protein-S-isoprenylcysteine O-methyltransferase Ste14